MTIDSYATVVVRLVGGPAKFVGMGYPVSRHWEDLREKQVPGLYPFFVVGGPKQAMSQLVSSALRNAGPEEA